MIDLTLSIGCGAIGSLLLIGLAVGADLKERGKKR